MPVGGGQTLWRQQVSAGDQSDQVPLGIEHWRLTDVLVAE